MLHAARWPVVGLLLTLVAFVGFCVCVPPRPTITMADDVSTGRSCSLAAKIDATEAVAAAAAEARSCGGGGW